MEPVTWWLAFKFGDTVFVDRAVWDVPPTISADAYAARVLYQLSIGVDHVVPTPPPGPVACAIYDSDPEAEHPAKLLGQAVRMFNPSDPVYGRA